MKNDIKRWINASCAGYQRTEGRITHSVIAGLVELQDGSTCNAWIVQRLPEMVFDGKNYSYGSEIAGDTVFEPPSIDQIVL